MPTAIVSDLHLGASSGRDLLRRPPVLEVLTGEFAGVDHLVLLGDTLELREEPLAAILDVARPVLGAIGDAMAGGRVTVVAGNHDHELAKPVTERSWPDGLPLDATKDADPPPPGVAGELVAALAPAEVHFAYPGIWLRDDVYATHGHYLDVHNTVPSLERLAIGAVGRAKRRRVPPAGARPGDYEAIVEPVYAAGFALAQRTRARRSNQSTRIWELLARPGIGPRIVGAVALPAAVGILNAAGLGPLSAEISGEALRDSALLGMNTVLDRLAIDAPHVVFGHTHRSGPHARDAGWGRLVNSGSWVLEPAFLGADPAASPYFPGHCVLVPDSGPPELRRLLEELPATGT